MVFLRRAKNFQFIVILLATLTFASSVSAKESWEDVAVIGAVSLMLSSLPPDVKVTYTDLVNNSRGRTFELKGLTVIRSTEGKTGSGALERLYISGVDVIKALSGRPFTAEHIEMRKLDVDECRSVKKMNRCRWSAKVITIDDAEAPSLVALMQANDNPGGAFQSLRFSRAVIDGTEVHSVPEALAHLYGKRVSR